MKMSLKGIGDAKRILTKNDILSHIMKGMEKLVKKSLSNSIKLIEMVFLLSFSTRLEAFTFGYSDSYSGVSGLGFGGTYHWVG